MKTIIALAAVILALPASAALRLPAVIGHNMCLQGGGRAAVWGWADPGQTVTVNGSWSRRAAEAKAGADGRWLVRLDTPEPGARGELVIRAGAESVTLTNVVAGDVWLCGGQSNMQMTMLPGGGNRQGVPDWSNEVASANWPDLRLFDVPRVTATQTLDDCKGVWKVCTPETVKPFSAVGYFFGRRIHTALKRPVGLVGINWGATRAETWMSPEALKPFGPVEPWPTMKFNDPSALYHGMVSPILPNTVKGAIWYQGESNINNARTYRTMFPAMIADWRARFTGGEFPFLFVQIAPFQYGDKTDAAVGELRDAQLETLRASRNTGMAVTTDIGEVADIHPRNKQDVGERLARWALAKTYGQRGIAYSGPLYRGHALRGPNVVVRFDHADGLTARGGDLREFAIAGADRNFVPAKAAIRGDEVIVSSDAVPQPAAVRFAWRRAPDPNLFSAAGLPASPFRTDDWADTTK